MKPKLRWQSTERQNKLLQPLHKIKEKYAKEVVSFMETLPSDLHRTAYFWACDVGCELSFKLTTADIQRRFENEKAKGEKECLKQ